MKISFFFISSTGILKNTSAILLSMVPFGLIADIFEYVENSSYYTNTQTIRVNITARNQKHQFSIPALRFKYRNKYFLRTTQTYRELRTKKLRS